MALQYLVALRNNMLDEINTLINAGAGAGKLRIYDGSQPATGGAVTTLLSENILSDPAAPAASAGVLTFSAISDDTAADATGTGTWFRIVDSNDVFVLDGPIADLNLNTNEITIGVNVEISGFVITEGNP
jgi:hypothetical protein